MKVKFRVCAGCKAEMPIPLHGGGAQKCRDGRYRCPGCVYEFRQTHSVQYNKRMNLVKYGLTLETYNSMVAKQGGSCAACGEKSYTLYVDHNHLTGKVRSLLCNKCNLGLGHFEDSVDKLLKAVEYLKQHSS